MKPMLPGVFVHLRERSAFIGPITGFVLILLSLNGNSQPALEDSSRPSVSMSVDTEERPAPEWSVWRAFYSTLESNSQRLPVARVESLPWLAELEYAAVLQAGSDFLAQIKAIDAEARQEMLTRFAPRDALPPPPGVGPREVIQLPYGQTLPQALEAAGITQRVEARKRLLLESHHQYLEQLIGTAELEELSRYVKNVVAPSVKDFKATRRFSVEGELPVTAR